MVRPNKPDMLKCSKKIQLGIYFITQSEHDIVAISGQWLDISGYQGNRPGVLLANSRYGYGKAKSLNGNNFSH